MYKLSPQSLKPGMIIYDDIYAPSKQLLYKANTILTPESIHSLQEYNFSDIVLCEPGEVNMTHYEYLQRNPHFQHFSEVHAKSLTAFSKIMRNLDTGLDLNQLRLMSLRDSVMAEVMNTEQFIDYLYNLMSNENEITYNHCFNCGLLCYVFGQWLELSAEDLDTITLCGYLFDIGKSKIPDDILWKPEKLTPEEYQKMQRHIHLGYEILKNRKLPPHIVTVLIMHHERCDGSGYPAGLKEDKIDPYALVAAIADTYDAMTHPRAQRMALTPFQAIRVFEKQGFAKYGKHIQPLLTRIAKIYIDRRVCLSNDTQGRITEIHDDALSSPTIFDGTAYHDLRKMPDAEVIRML